MRNIDTVTVKREVTSLIERCLIEPDRAVTEKLENLCDAPLASYAAKLIAENNRIAKEKKVFACQDTGQALIMVRLGDEAYCPGLRLALEEAVRAAYSPARKSVADPLTRLNTKDNTPPIIETEIVSGDGLEISFLAKGAGSENMAKLYMLKPADGEDGIISSIVDAVSSGGANACPPLVVGVGIGGVAETACMLSKRALLRPIGQSNARADAARLEKIALEKVNALGIGVAAFGGNNTALAVNIELAPTHIGMLPVAVNLQCHSLRHGTVKL
ncbi:MAG: fumarate hydratase [Clostridiales bacterium]|nr:fumarate hydratase [Clostridiales bacterium]